MQKGDTLWGISGKFLKDPWRWPDIWRMNNDQIRNPHLIYPGDVVMLERASDGKPQLIARAAGGTPRADRAFDTARSPGDPADPARATSSPILSRPLISDVDRNGRRGRNRGRTRRARRAGPDDVVYVGRPRSEGRRSAGSSTVPANGSLNDKGELLGYENKFLGTARVENFAEVSTVRIESATEEVVVGDRLLPAPRETLPELRAACPRQGDRRAHPQARL